MALKLMHADHKEMAYLFWENKTSKSKYSAYPLCFDENAERMKKSLKSDACSLMHTSALTIQKVFRGHLTYKAFKAAL